MISLTPREAVADANKKLYFMYKKFMLESYVKMVIEFSKALEFLLVTLNQRMYFYKIARTILK